MSSSVPLADLPLAIRRNLPHDSPQLDDFAAEVEGRYGLPTGWLRAVKNAGERSESTGPRSVSPKGARGVMQFIPGTAERYGLKDPTDPLAAIEAAGKYGADLNAQFHGDPVLMAGGYNAGEAHPGLKDPSQLPAETRAYMERVKAALPTLGAAGSAVPEHDLPAEASRETARLKGATRQEQYRADRKLYSPVNPNPFMSGLEGAGKSVADTYHGLKEMFGGESPEAADERAHLDAPLMNDGAGVTGNVLGQLAQIYLPATGLAKGAQGVRALKAVGSIDSPLAAAARFLTSLPAQATALGGGFAATQPVTSDSSRGLNTGEGALLALGGDRLLRGARSLVVPAWDKSTAAVADLARTAMDKYDIPLRASQISDSPSLAFLTKVIDALPFSGTKKKLAEQTGAFTERLNETVGQRGRNLTDGLRSARDELGRNYTTIEGRNDALLSPAHITAMTRAANAVTPFDTTPNKAVVGSLHELVDHLIQVADPQTGAIPGTVYKSIRQDLKAAANNPSLPAKAQEAYRLFKDQLDDAFHRGVVASGNPEDLALLQQTDKRWGNMRTLENLAPKGAEDAAPDIRQLASVLRGKSRVNQANRSGALYGTGDQTLPELSRIGAEFLNDDITGSTSFLGRLKTNKLLHLGELGGVAGGLYALNHTEESPVKDTAEDLAKLFLATKLGGSALNSRWFARGFPGSQRVMNYLESRGAAQALPDYVRAASGAVQPGAPADENGAEVPFADQPGGR